MEDFEKFLASFFNYASQLCFDKSRELLEKERDITKNALLKQLIALLFNFVEAEKTYFNLGFLSVKNKIFLRKENSLRSMYESLKTDLHRVEEGCGTDRTIAFVVPIITQLTQFLTVRVQLVDMYEKMYVMGISPKPVKYDDLQSQVEVIIEMHSFSFPHSVLAPEKAIITWECEILRNLLCAQIELQSWSFLSSLLYLQAAHSLLCTWEKSLQGKESWKLGFGVSLLKSATQLPALCQWLCKLKCAIISKFSFYFYITLAQQSSLHEVKAILASKAGKITDHYSRLQTIQKRSMANVAVLVFEIPSLSSWAGPEYLQPDRPLEATTEDYKVMLSYPKPFEHMAQLSQALSERSPDYVLADKVRACVKDNLTFFMSCVDPRVSFVLVFDSKKEEKEASIITNMIEFCSQLRYAKVYAALKVSK